jgi:hypothetical protein
MPYRIAGIDVHKKMLAWWLAMWKSMAITSLNGSVTAVVQSICDSLRNG